MKGSFFWKIINIYGIALILLNGVNTGVDGLMNRNILKSGLSFFSHQLYMIIALIIGGVSIYLGRQRDVYLTFLADTVMPCSILTNKTPSNATVSTKVKVPPNTKVVYWASEPLTKTNTSLDSPKEAYGDYKNMGVATSNKQGIAVLKVRKPRGYKVKKMLREKILKPHIHYRYCKSPGMMSRIETVYV
tara:strand:- start:79 stop:645 length:567 start_codon:yes stop_codon:yes gene_type:complete